MKKGFALTELLLVVGILLVLLVLGAVIFRSFAQQDQVLMEARKVESLINEARAKAVAGFSSGGAQALNYGVHFQSDRYFLFSGLTFDEESSNNQVLFLPSSLEFSEIGLAGDSLVFEKISGEVRNFDSNQNYVVLTDSESQGEKKISVNLLGVVVVEKP